MMQKKGPHQNISTAKGPHCKNNYTASLFCRRRICNCKVQTANTQTRGATVLPLKKGFLVSLRKYKIYCAEKLDA
jgi:hypothetical protein